MREEALTGEKGGGRGWGTMCASEAASSSSSLKNRGPLNLKTSHTFLMIRSFLKDCQLMKKKHPCTAQAVYLVKGATRGGGMG
jgi:hypothetical protein